MSDPKAPSPTPGATRGDASARPGPTRAKTPLQRLLGPDWETAYATPEEQALADLILTTIEELEMMTARLNRTVAARVAADETVPRRWEILADLGRVTRLKVPNH